MLAQTEGAPSTHAARFRYCQHPNRMQCDELTYLGLDGLEEIDGVVNGSLVPKSL